MTAPKRKRPQRRRTPGPAHVHVEAQDLKATVTPAIQPPTQKVSWWNKFSLGRLGTEAGAIIALAGLIYGTFDYVIPYLDRQWNSDNAPHEGRAEHLADIKAQTDLRIREEQEHQRADKALADQLTAQSSVTKDLLDSQKLAATKQRGDFIESLNNRMRNLQTAIDVAKANSEKDPSAANQKVLETLQAQMPALQRQIMEAAVP